MNYDFKSNWESIVVPHLKTRPIRQAIRKTIEYYISYDKYGHNLKPYKPSLCMAEWSTGDIWFTACETFKAKKIEELIKVNIIRVISTDDAKNEKTCDKYDKYVDNILKPYMKHFYLYSLEAHQAFGACHAVNSIFGIVLAKLVCPNEIWRVLSGPNHTTIVNVDKSKVFDIIRFFEDRPNLGGSDAIIDAEKPEYIHRFGDSDSDSDSESD